MKIKKIRIKGSEEFFEDALKVAKALDRGERPARRREEEYFDSLEAARNVLTEKRLELWRLIRDRRPRSLSELAKLASRDFKNVHRDVGVLVAVGLVELKKGKGQRGDTQVPSSLADALTLEVA